MRPHMMVIIALVGTLLGPLWPARAASEFTVISLGDLFPTDINNAGQVVGYVRENGVNHAALWHDGTMTRLGALPTAGDCQANAINNLGQVVGYCVLADYVIHSFLWQAGEEMVDLGVLGGNETVAHDINDLGQVTGIVRTVRHRDHFAFIWQDGTFQTLGIRFASGYGINNAGVVAGADTFPEDNYTGPARFQDGQSVRLEHDRNQFGIATDINTIGDVVGYVGSNNEQAYVWRADGMHVLPGLDGTSTAYGLNNKDQTVGYVGICTWMEQDGVPVCDGYEHLPALWDNDELIELDIVGDGWGEARAINDLGQIVGFRYLRTSTAPEGILWLPNTTEQTPPTTTATLSGTPGVTGWYTRPVTVTLLAKDNPGGSGVATITYRASGAQPRAEVTVPSGSTSFTLTMDGITTFEYFATDRQGNKETPETLTVKVDTTAVQMQSPVPRLRPAALQTTTIPVDLIWTGHDGNGSGVVRYQVQQSTNMGPYHTVMLASAPEPRFTSLLYPGTNTYRFQVRAADLAGNISPYKRSPLFLLYAQQETSLAITYTGPDPKCWRGEALAGAYGNAVRQATQSRCRATALFTGTSVGFVTTRGPDRGMADIWLDGTRMATLDLYNPAIMPKDMVWTINGLANTTHTLEVRVLGKQNQAARGKRIDVDAFVVIVR